jgi:hypothetical protein
MACNMVVLGYEEATEYEVLCMKEGSVFHCPIISKVLSRNRFNALIRCFHTTNPATYVSEKGLPRYDKLG